MGDVKIFILIHAICKNGINAPVGVISQEITNKNVSMMMRAIRRVG
jgi:hypothetical protein